MSKMFNYAQDFLDDDGEELGYSVSDLPHLDDMSASTICKSMGI